MGHALEIRPIAGAIGAELHGVDLSDDLSADTIAVIRQALLDHLVIFFRHQNIAAGPLPGAVPPLRHTDRIPVRDGP